MSAPKNGQGRTYANLNLNATLSGLNQTGTGGGGGLAQAASAMTRNGVLLLSKVRSLQAPLALMATQRAQRTRPRVFPRCGVLRFVLRNWKSWWPPRGSAAASTFAKNSHIRHYCILGIVISARHSDARGPRAQHSHARQRSSSLRAWGSLLEQQARRAAS